MNKTKKILLAGSLTPLMVASGFFGVSFFSSQEDDSKISIEDEQQTRADIGLIKESIEIDDAVVVSTDNLNLAFNMPGKVQEIFAEEGSKVSKGDSLIKLDTTEIDLEIKGLKASLSKAQSNLDKILSGATNESVQIYKTQVAVYKDSVEAYKKNLVDIIKSSYTVSEDAVRGKTNSLFTDPNSSNPQLVFTVGDTSLEANVESRRKNLEEDLDDWNEDLEDLDDSDDLNEAMEDADDFIDDVKAYLEDVANLVDRLTTASGNDQDTIDAWNLAVSTGRTNVDKAKVNIKEASIALSGIEGNRDVAKKNLDFVDSAARTEDVGIAQAQVDSISSQIDLLEYRLREMTLKAPEDGMVMKNLYKEAEIIPLGQVVTIFSTHEKKVEVNISEEDISEIKVDSQVKIEFKAFSSKKINGKVLSIKPNPILENGEVYYRSDISLGDYIPGLMEGMTATVWIETGEKDNVLRVPNRFIVKIGTNNFVNILEEGEVKEVEVKIGSFDNEFSEIESGLKENDILFLPDY